MEVKMNITQNRNSSTGSTQINRNTVTITFNSESQCTKKQRKDSLEEILRLAAGTIYK